MNLLMIIFIKIDESIDDWDDVNEYRHKIFTLAQSHSLAWLLELTGVNLRASGVVSFPALRVLKYTMQCPRFNLLISAMRAVP